MENFKHIPHEDEYDANAFYITSDPSYVGGIAPEPRRYPPEPALDTRLELEENVNELVIERTYTPRSHFQPEVKVRRESKKWRMVGDVIAFLFLAFGFGLMLVYFGAFRVIGAVIHEVMQ